MQWGGCQGLELKPEVALQLVGGDTGNRVQGNGPGTSLDCGLAPGPAPRTAGCYLVAVSSPPSPQVLAVGALFMPP